MANGAAPQNKFGFTECCPGPCPPESEVGLAAYHLGFWIFLVVVIVSLVAGMKFSRKSWALPILAMAAVASIMIQLAQEKIVLDTYQNHMLIRRYESGPGTKDIERYEKSPFKDQRYVDLFEREARRSTAFANKEISEIPDRYKRIFVKGWLAYSVLPFAGGIVFAAFKRRRKRIRETASDAEKANTV